MVQNGEFIWHWFPFFGWLGGKMYTRRMFERVVEKHIEVIKKSCEARSARSHIFRKREATRSG